MLNYNIAIEAVESLANYCRGLTERQSYDICNLTADCLLIVFTLYDSNKLDLHKTEQLYKMLMSRNDEDILLAAELIINLKVPTPKPSIMNYLYGYLIWHDIHHNSFKYLLAHWEIIYDNKE